MAPNLRAAFHLFPSICRPPSFPSFQSIPIVHRVYATQGRGKYLASSHTWSHLPRTPSSPGLWGSSGQSRVLSTPDTFWASLNLHRVSLGPAPGPYCASAGAGGGGASWWCRGGAVEAEKGRGRAGPSRPQVAPLYSSPLSRTARQNPSRMLCEVNTTVS